MLNSLFIYDFHGKRIPVNIRPVVYCTAISESTDSKEWDHLWNAFKMTNVAAEQRVLMEALGCSKKADVLKVIFISTSRFPKPIDTFTRQSMQIELYSAFRNI